MDRDLDPVIQRALRQVKTNRTLGKISGYSTNQFVEDRHLSIEDLSIHERAERATLDHFEKEAGTVVTIADREILRGDLVDLAETLHRNGYTDVTLFHPSSIHGIPPFDIDAHGWKHDGLALAVAPEALCDPRKGTPLARTQVQMGGEFRSEFVVRHPDGVALAKTVTTDFEWGES